MRALLLDGSDNTLIVTDVVEITYCIDEKYIYISGSDDDFTIEGLEQFEAEDIIRRIYLDGMIDLTRYTAEME